MRELINRRILRRLFRNIFVAYYSYFERDTFSRYAIGVASIKSQRVQYAYLSDIRQAEVQVFSQNGEDGILDYIFETIGLVKPAILELGCGDFNESNSRFTNLFRSSPTYIVDAGLNVETTYATYEDRRVHSLFFCENIWIERENAAEILARAEKSLGRVDVLSLDLDGNDFWILQNIPLNNIKVVVLEYNPSILSGTPSSVVYDSKFDRTKKHYSYKYYGANFEAFESFLRLKNFCFVGATSQGTNAFFVSKEFESNFSRVLKPAALYLNLDSREARNSLGQLSFIDNSSERKLIEDMPYEHNILIE